MAQDESKLRVQICNKRPIELIDFTEGLLSLGNQYKKFIVRNPDLSFADDVSLFIKEVKTGSIIADLVPMAAATLPFIVDFNNIATFLTNLKLAYSFFVGKTNKKPEIDKQDLNQLSKIINPVARDNGSNINIYTILNGDIRDSFNMTSVEANAAQNGIDRELKLLKEPTSKLKEKVILYWYQSRNDPDCKTGDLGIIESVKPTPVKTIFDSEGIKASMVLNADENPFHYAYIVDVVVDTINDNAALYKIVKFHERFKKPEEGV